MTERILTLHPQGKTGVNIKKVKYDSIKEAILASLGEQEELTFNALNQHVQAKLKDCFDGSIPWYVTTVKLDLEARGMIERIPKTSPQRLRLKDSERVKGH